ncbi:MAG: class I SAM-dependent methyltransferase [Bacteroidota bacterium]
MDSTYNESFEKVSMTAKFVAYWRQYTDIPFAKDVAEFINASEAIESFFKKNQIARSEIRWYAPLFEIRYKSIDEVLRRQKPKQILELASGLSLRGLTMTQNREIVYVETDLEELTNDKRILVSILNRKYVLAGHSNFHLASVNALDARQLQTAIRHFPKKQPIAVVNEGLLPYLTRSEIEIVARNIRDLLTQFGGVWITPDFSLKENSGPISAQRGRIRDILKILTGRQLHRGAFDNEEQLVSFLENLGLHTEQLYQTDLVSSVVSIGALKISNTIFEKLKRKLRLWVLTPA